MRSLYISIIVTVLGSLFFIGWGLDELVEYSSENIVTESQSTQTYRKLLNGLSTDLSSLAANKLAKEVDKFKQVYQINTSLVASQTIALPQSLSEQLDQQGGLLLASNANLYLLKNIVNHDDYILRIELPAELEENDSFHFLLTLILYVSICGIHG